MHYWLMKSEPTSFSIDDLAAVMREPWSGVRNFQARNFIREMKSGDQALFHHSSTDPIGVAGIMRICSDPYPDPTQYDPGSPYFDPKATKIKPIWYLVDVCFIKKFKKFVSLAQIKSDPALRDMLVAQRGSRLSIQPVSEKHFRLIKKLGA